LVTIQKETDVGRQYRKQINDPIEAEYVSHLFMSGNDTKTVFYCEEYREDPFSYKQYIPISIMDACDTIEHNHNNTQDDGDHQGQVKKLSAPGFCSKNNIVKFLFYHFTTKIGKC